MQFGRVAKTCRPSAHAQRRWRSGALVEQDSSHLVAALEHRQIGQKSILGRELRDHVLSQVLIRRVGTADKPSPHRHRTAASAALPGG